MTRSTDPPARASAIIQHSSLRHYSLRAKGCVALVNYEQLGLPYSEHEFPGEDLMVPPLVELRPGILAGQGITTSHKGEFLTHPLLKKFEKKKEGKNY